MTHDLNDCWADIETVFEENHPGPQGSYKTRNFRVPVKFRVQLPAPVWTPEGRAAYLGWVAYAYAIAHEAVQAEIKAYCDWLDTGTAAVPGPTFPPAGQVR